MKGPVMCEQVLMPGAILSTVGGLIAQGWDVRADDFAPGTPGENRNLMCLCPLDVEAVLDRAGVAYVRDPFGWEVT